MMKQDSQTELLAGVGQAQDPHRSLHSETGARPGEHPGRSKNPLVKVAGLAWLEFGKPDLDRAERFGTDFGFTIADRTPETLLLGGRQAAAGWLAPPGSARRWPRTWTPSGCSSATSCTWTGSATGGRRWRSSGATWAASPPTTTPWPWPCSHTPATCTRPTSSPTWTRWPPAGSTCASAATGTPGARAGTSWAARSSTTGATRTG